MVSIQSFLYLIILFDGSAAVQSKYESFISNEKALNLISQYNNKAIKTIDELKKKLASENIEIGRSTLIGYLGRLKVKDLLKTP